MTWLAEQPLLLAVATFVVATVSATALLWFRAVFVRQRRQVERLTEEIAELRESGRRAEQVLVDTCRELRTPLYGMVGLAQSLLDRDTGDLAEGDRTSLVMLAGTGRRLGNAVTEVVDRSLLDDGRLTLERQAVDLRTCLDMVLTLSRPAAEAKGLTLLVEADRDLPPAHADRQRLLQILQNFFSWAVELVDRGTIRVTARVQARELQVTAVIPHPPSGIDPGQGSALTRRLVELHGGWIWSEAGPPGRRYLVLTLPASDQEAVPFEAPEVLQRLRSEAPSVTVAPSARGPSMPLPPPSDPEAADRILVVDDDPAVRGILGAQLQDAGLAVVEAAGGAEALDLLAEEHFDLVILDVRMPEMTGYDVCRAIRARRDLKELPILFLTGLGDAEDLISGFAVGANDYLVKPVSQGDLLARVKIHLTSTSAGSFRRRLRMAVRSYEDERELRRQLFEARERERRRLAQELHDGPIQDLHALVLRLTGASTEEAADLQTVAADLRTICTELRPPALMVGGLASSVRALAARIQERGEGPRIELDLMDDGGRLTESTRLHLFRIFQEALANAVQHAEAERVRLAFELDAEGCSLEVWDDGQGFEVPERWVDLARRERFGLVGIVERAEAIGGVLDLRSSPGEGTRLRVEVSRAALEVMNEEETLAEAVV